MPYIPPKNRPPINKCVDALADEVASTLASKGVTAEVSEHYRTAFVDICSFIARLEQQPNAKPSTKAQELASSIVEAAKAYQQKGGWQGELNYAITILIQAVPFKMVEKGAWTDHLRYWLYAQTVGALVRTSYDMHASYGNGWIGNGLAGVFEDVKDEYKRRVNTAYEAAQILKSGDCFDMTSFRTQLVEQTIGGVKGYQEVMLPQQKPSSIFPAERTEDHGVRTQKPAQYAC
jgi:hypothetical protein